MTDAKRGRPPLSPLPSVKYTLKMTPEQRAKLERLGGAERVRKWIDRARESQT